jgi:hypothetical protein
MYISLGFQYNAFEFYGTIKFLCLKCSDSKVLGHIVISLHYRASQSLSFFTVAVIHQHLRYKNCFSHCE